MSTNPWRDSKLFPDSICFGHCGVLPPRTDPKQPSRRPSLDPVASQGPCKRQQLSSSTQFLLAHATSNLGKKRLQGSTPSLKKCQHLLYNSLFKSQDFFQPVSSHFHFTLFLQSTASLFTYLLSHYFPK